MMSHEYPPQALPPFCRMPKGPPEMPLRLSDTAVFFRNCSVWLLDMCPYFSRSHLTMASGALELQGWPGGIVPPPPPPPAGGAAGASGALKDSVGDQSVVISP